MAKAFLTTEAPTMLPAGSSVSARTSCTTCSTRCSTCPKGICRCSFPLPKLLPPELEALRYAIDDDDPDAVDEHLGPTLQRVDNPQQRAGLAHAVLALADGGIINAAVADAAILDLDSHRTSELMGASLLQALSVSVGASRTPAGLLVVSR